MSATRFAGRSGAHGRNRLGWDVIGRDEPSEHPARDRALMKATMVLLIVLYLVVLFVLLGLPGTTDAHCGLPQHRTLDAATLESRRGCAEHPPEIRHDPAGVDQRTSCADGLTAGPCPERPSLPARRHPSVEQGAR